jgi:hypothetical protein
MLFSCAFFLNLNRITDLRRWAREDEIGEDEQQELDSLMARFGNEIEELDRLQEEFAASPDPHDVPFPEEVMTAVD